MILFLKQLFSSIQKSIPLFTRSKKINRILDVISFIYFRYLTEDGLVLREINKYLMFLDLRTRGISQTLFFQKKREVLETEIVKKEIKKRYNCIDIGANIGYYCLLEANLISNENIVYAIEPDHRNLNLLKKNIEINSFQNIELHKLAVTEENKISIMHHYMESNLNTLVPLSNENKVKKNIIHSVPIKTVSIDSFLKKKKNPPINFIRMDIEGFECEAIDGMLNTLMNQKDEIKIMIEFHPRLYSKERDFTKRLRKLDKLGFTVKYIISAEKAYHELISERGYKPIKIITEVMLTHGLYKDVKMDDLIDFINSERKIVRAGFFVRSAIR